MPIGKASYSGSPYLGVYLRVGERTGVLPSSCPTSLQRTVEHVLGVRTVRTNIAEAEVVGALVAMNGHGLIVSAQAEDKEVEALRREFHVTTLESKLNALGNTILTNDQGAVVHPEFTAAERATIGKALGVPVVPSTVAGLGTVAKAAVVTPKGVVVHPRASEKEVAVLEKALGVSAHKSTANFGIPLVGACLVANSRGILTGDLTTPVEIVHLQEGLQVFD